MYLHTGNWKANSLSTMQACCAVGVAACVLVAGRINAQDMGDGDEDQGAAIAAQADAKAGTLPMPAPSDEFVSAEELVQQNLEKMNLFQGYDSKRSAIIAIGTAEVKIADPANEPDFIAIRAAKANEAYINAKAEVIRSINTEFSAMDRALAFAEFGQDETQKSFAENHAKLEEKRADLTKKLAQLDKAEAEAVRGVTMSDRFGMILEGVAKRLDGKSNSADVAAQKKALYAQLKSECDQLQADFKELEELAGKIPAAPSAEVSSAAKMLSKMPLLGSSVLTQAESWDKTTQIYAISMAIVWSPKLQENAEALVNGAAAPSSKKGQFSVHEWVRNQNLVNMIGPRRFTDNEGNNIFVGIAAADMTGKVKDRKAKKMLAEMEARKAIAFSLAGDIEAFREASQNYKEYDDDQRTSIQKLNDVVSQKCDLNLQGCLPLAQKEVTHPITGHRIYVVAYYIEPLLAKDAAELMRKSYAGAVRQTKATQFRRGQNEGMARVLENQRNSKEDYNRGLINGASEVVSESRPAQPKPQAPVGATGSKPPANSGRSQGGAFSGDTSIDTDF